MENRWTPWNSQLSHLRLHQQHVARFRIHYKRYVVSFSEDSSYGHLSYLLAQKFEFRLADFQTNFPRSKLWLIDFEAKFSRFELRLRRFWSKILSFVTLWLIDFEINFPRLKLWLIDFEINLSRLQLWLIDIEINFSRSTYRFWNIFLSFKTSTRRFWSKILSFGIKKKKKNRNRLWIWRNYLLNIVYVESDTKFWSLILERNVRADSWKKRIHYGKFDVLLGSSSHLSFLHDWCTARVSFELCPIRKTTSFLPFTKQVSKGASRNSLIKLARH